MTLGEIVFQANAWVREHDRVRVAAHRATQPLRRRHLPVLVGPGRGLRLRVGESTLTRLASSVEPDVESAFVSLISPGVVVYDIGANIGWFSLLAARRGARVIAFEPSPANASQVEANAHANRLSNIQVVRAAVSDHNGWARFSPDDSLQGVLRDDGSLLVPVITLDSWVAAGWLPAPDVVKIDVEGSELQVLDGMKAIMGGARPRLVLELHDTGPQVAAALDGAGYEHAPVEADCATRDAPGWAHILAR